MPATVQEEPSIEDRFLQAFEGLSDEAKNGTVEAVQGRRRRAIEQFEALGFPTNQLEAYKYTNVAKALRHAYRIAPAEAAPQASKEEVEALLLPDLDAHVVVTVGGRYSEERSDVGALPNGAFVGSFAEGANAHPDVFDAHYGQYADFESEAGDPEQSAMTALNAAFAQDGLFLYVPEGAALDKPVYALHLPSAGDEPLFAQPRHLFVVEENAEARLIEMHRAPEHYEHAPGSFTNAVREAYVGAHGHFDHYIVQDEGAGASQHTTFGAYHETESVFDTLAVTLSGDLVRNNLTLTPAGEFCESHLNGLYLSSGEMHVDNRTIVEHAAPDCVSNQLYKGILEDDATGVFNGRVHVHRGSQRINAYQSNKNIVLERSAQIYSKPELEIYADDVECSHGSTTGELDEDAIFYLRSRGIPAERARAMLLGAFARDVVENVRSEPLAAWLTDEVGARYGAGQALGVGS
jgi:Fe-S cluster assembly protein SufD